MCFPIKLTKLMHTTFKLTFSPYFQQFLREHNMASYYKKHHILVLNKNLLQISQFSIVRCTKICMIKLFHSTRAYTFTPNNISHCVLFLFETFVMSFFLSVVFKHKVLHHHLEYVVHTYILMLVHHFYNSSCIHSKIK